jgi:lycopene cyclase domain-containing protein
MLKEHFYYLIIDIACLSFPYLFSFHPAIRFYKEWKAIFKALFITAFIFIVWDEWFTRMEVWSFNPRYTIGIYLGNLPIEEILFFLFIPYCLMFMYHCSARYFKSFTESDKNIRYINSIVGAVILVVGLINNHKWYTGFTFIITGILLAILSLLPYGKRINWNRFWIIYAFGLIPFFIVNGLLTSIPIVLYNNHENLAVRLTTIPVEDTIYNLLLFLCNVSLYEWFRKK